MFIYVLKVNKFIWPQKNGHRTGHRYMDFLLILQQLQSLIFLLEYR